MSQCVCEKALLNDNHVAVLDHNYDLEYKNKANGKHNPGWFIIESDLRERLKINYCPVCGKKLMVGLIEEVYFDDTANT